MILQLVFVSFLVTTLVQSDIPNDPNKASSHENPQVVGSVFDKYVRLIRNAIDAAELSLSHSKENIQEKVSLIARQLQASLQEECAKLLKELHSLIREAKASGIDIQVCITESEPGIIDHPMKFANEILKCQEDVMNKGLIIINEAKYEVEKASKELNTFIGRYNGCSGLLADKCYTEVTAEISQESERIPVALPKALEKVTAFESNIQATLENCGSHTVHAADSKGERIIHDIAVCIESNQPVS